LGRRAEAIAVLEHAVRVAPEAWDNWELLGNYYSEDARYDDATLAYEQALHCQNVRVECITANQAILLMKRGDLANALRLVEAVDAPDLAFHKASVQAQSLLQAGQAREAVELCQTLRYSDELTPAQKRHLASVCVTQAHAMVALDVPKQGITEHLRAALSAIPDSEPLLTCYRQLQNRTSDSALLFSVVTDFELDPKLRSGLHAVGFLRSGRAVADYAEEALQFFRELEDDRLLVFSEAPEICAVAEDAGPLKGITARTPRIYYQSRE
jgi:tetratricopeptide (TPR) repeat protein